MKEYGLIGYPLSHSFSAGYFAEKFRSLGIRDYMYSNFPLQNLDGFMDLIHSRPALLGLNVTIPYKEKVIPYLDYVEENIAAIGAVNTIKIERYGETIQLKGYNTDVYGFGESLKTLLSKSHTRALILGTGGASKAVHHVLAGLGMDTIVVSRTPRKENQISYEMVTPEIISKTEVIVNTSPLGMYPNTGSCPAIPYEYLTSNHILYDLVYNPEETLFMKNGIKRGARVMNGLKMLHLQAEKSWEIWNT